MIQQEHQPGQSLHEHAMQVALCVAHLFQFGCAIGCWTLSAWLHSHSAAQCSTTQHNTACQEHNALATTLKDTCCRGGHAILRVKAPQPVVCWRVEDVSPRQAGRFLLHSWFCFHCIAAAADALARDRHQQAPNLPVSAALAAGSEQLMQ
jgi:hypothetical protein